MLVDGDEEVDLFATNNEILASNFRATQGEMTFDSSARRIKGAAAEEMDRIGSNEKVAYGAVDGQSTGWRSASPCHRHQ